MAGEIFKPKRIMLRGNITETVNLNAMIDGSVDMNMSPEMALTGMATRHLNADPPGAFIFICACGHKRRVTHSETNFRCERGGVGPSCECDIIWYRKQRPTEEVDENGQTIYEDETTKEQIETVDEFSGKKLKKMIDVPVFYGRKVGEVRAEEFKKRKEEGRPIFATPSDHVNLKQTGGEKPVAKSGEGIFKK